MAVHWGGVIGMIVFYILILAVGLWAARKTRGNHDNESSQQILLADRKFGWVICIITMIASWVDGGIINGSAEMIFSSGYGLIWSLGPILTVFGLIINSLFFVGKMRDAEYSTMLDPFAIKYGVRMAAFIFLTALMGEVLFAAAILTALGSSISVILNIDRVLSVVISSCIAAFYTLFGGLWSVAYTDVVQLIIMFFGLWLCVPFAITNPAVVPISETQVQWTGQWENKFVWIWIDLAFLFLLGCIPWQVFYQRALAAKSATVAKYSTVAAALGVLIAVIPAYLIGVIGASTNWSETSINLNRTDLYENPSLILPAVIQYLTPAPVAFIGLGAVSAAVMSSTDSTFLSISSMFCTNIYKDILRTKASERELIWVMRVTVVIIAAAACFLALAVKSTYGLLVVCAEFVYVALFPQLVCVIHVPISNTYGSVASYLVALLLRLTAGEPTLNLPPVIHYPLFEVYDGVPTQFFPFRTFIMVIALITLVLVSFATDVIFRRGWLRKEWDVFRCVVNVNDVN